MLNKTISMSSSCQKSSNFAQTCNLLSQYLKENGSLGDFSCGFASKPAATTMNLLPSLENAGASSFPSVKPADFFSNKAEATMEIGAAGSQMTIFYAGKVHVFNDFSAEKANEIMALASKSGSSINTSSRAFTPDLNIASNASGSDGISSQERLIQQLKPPAAPITSDFPIKRRASLHRFLEKRKDR